MFSYKLYIISVLKLVFLNYLSMGLPHFSNHIAAKQSDPQPISTCKNCGSQNFIMEKGVFKIVGKTPDAKQNLFQCDNCGWQGTKYEIIKPYYNNHITMDLKSNFYFKEELYNIGFKSYGKNVLISRKCSIYNSSNISIGNNVRIDDFCILSAGEDGIEIGNYVHVAAYSSLIGKRKIILEDFSNISSRVSIYSSSDDYSGKYMTNPMVPEKYTGVEHASVTIGKHVIIGSGSVVLPGAFLKNSSAFGSLSLILGQTYDPFTIYAGIPIKAIKKRSNEHLELEKQLKQEKNV